MDKIFDILEGIFSVETFGNLKLYDLMAIIFKYIFPDVREVIAK